jgi:hypothetical protein
MKESRFYKKYEKWVKASFPSAYMYRTSDKFRLGVPDFTMSIDGYFIGLEIKKEGQKLRQNQIEELIDIENSGGYGFMGIGYELIWIYSSEHFDIREVSCKEVMDKCLSTQRL